MAFGDLVAPGRGSRRSPSRSGSRTACPSMAGLDHEMVQVLQVRDQLRVPRLDQAALREVLTHPTYWRRGPASARRGAFRARPTRSPCRWTAACSSGGFLTYEAASTGRRRSYPAESRTWSRRSPPPVGPLRHRRRAGTPEDAAPPVTVASLTNRRGPIAAAPILPSLTWRSFALGCRGPELVARGPMILASPPRRRRSPPCGSSS